VPYQGEASWRCQGQASSTMDLVIVASWRAAGSADSALASALFRTSPRLADPAGPPCAGSCTPSHQSAAGGSSAAAAATTTAWGGPAARMAMASLWLETTPTGVVPARCCGCDAAVQRTARTVQLSASPRRRFCSSLWAPWMCARPAPRLEAFAKPGRTEPWDGANRPRLEELQVEPLPPLTEEDLLRDPNRCASRKRPLAADPPSRRQLRAAAQTIARTA